MNTRKIETLKISDDMRAKLEALDNAPQDLNWTPEQDAIVLEYYPKKRKDQLAELLGVSKSSLLSRYNKLTRDKQ